MATKKNQSTVPVAVTAEMVDHVQDQQSNDNGNDDVNMTEAQLDEILAETDALVDVPPSKKALPRRTHGIDPNTLPAPVEPTVERPAHIPPRLTAEATARLVQVNEELEADEMHEKTVMWSKVDTLRHNAHEWIERLNHLAWHSSRTIQPSELQSILVQFLEQEANVTEAFTELKNYHEALTRRRQYWTLMTADVLAHRSAAHAHLRPGETTRVPVTTGTLGPEVTDEEAHLMGIAMDM